MTDARNMRKIMETVKQLSEVEVNYDKWNTKPASRINSNHNAILQLMSDGKARERSDMIRQATDMDPNPRSEMGFAGWNKIDYDLYKHGLLDVVDILPGGKKVFRINIAGKRLAKKLSECSDCGGDGYAPDDANYLHCKTCKGSGTIGGTF